MRKKKIDPKKVDQRMVSYFSLIITRMVRDLEKKYGKDVRNLVKKSFIDLSLEDAENQFKNIEVKSLENFIDYLLKDINVSHEYKIIEKTPEIVKLEFTNCPYANAFRALDASDIGEMFCLVDKPVAKLFHRDMEFKITKRIMHGDTICNHQYTMKPT